MTITINGNGTVTGVSVGGLPDGIVDNDMIANTTIAEGKLAADVNTITEADIWRITSGVETGTGGAELHFNANWERADTYQAGKIGTGMSESSGIFTFPSTGLWQIDFRAVGKKSSATIKYIAAQIKTTINNSAYNAQSQAYTWIESNGGGCWTSLNAIALFDVTDTSNCKCKFVAGADLAFGFYGDSSTNQTYAIFTRLGDT